ncbi:MAG: glycerate kinase [Puniceicoccaceae bacterium]
MKENVISGPVLVAFDKFKGALAAGEACRIAASAIRGRGGAVLAEAPLTDGGEGFCAILTSAAGGTRESVEVPDPIGRTIRADLGWVDSGRLAPAARDRLGCAGDERIAVAEMASASGLPLLAGSERDPWKTSTAGTGALLRRAVERGADRILLGVGGSATNDVGAGALAALGVRFLDESGATVDPVVPGRFSGVAAVDFRDAPGLPPVVVASDVESPLLGPRGAASVFGPQKGLSDVAGMERAVERMAGLLRRGPGRSPDPDAPGMGAAGGITFGLSALCRVRIVPGFALFSDWMGLDELLARADWVVTGEGRLDAGSLTGKGPVALLRAAARKGRRLAVFAGAVEEEAASALGHELGRFHRAVLSAPGEALAESLAATADRLGASVGRWWESLG